MRHSILLLALFTCLAAAPKPLHKDAKTTDWPNFLGPAHAPVSTETHLAKELASPMPVVWSVEKGTGYAAPSVLGDHLVLFHRVKDEEIVDFYHAQTGERIWRYAYACTYQDRYGYTNGPRCAPAIDSTTNQVFTFGVEGKLSALNLTTGKVTWSRDILADFKLEPNFFGVGASPLVEGDLLIINVGAKDARVVAFETKTGKTRWTAPAPQNWGPSYASPIPATVQGLRRVFVFAGGESRPATGGLLCLDPKTGTVDFAFPWRGKRYESVNASSPLVVDNKVFISECYGRGGVLLELVLDNQKLAPKELWANEKLSTHFMTAIYQDGFLYGCDGHGPNNCPLVCLDFKTGEEKWRTEPDLSETVKLPTGEEKQLKLNPDRCHLLQVDGKVLCLTEWGHLVYLDLSPAGVKVRSRTWLFAAGETWSPPVLSKGLLYINQNTPDSVHSKPPRLLCYDLRE